MRPTHPLSLRFLPLYLLGFLFSFSTALPSFYNALFVVQSGYTPEDAGLIYTGASIVAFAGFLLSSLLLQTFGNARLATTAALTMALSMLSLSLQPGFWGLAVSLVAFLSVQMIMSTFVDVFIETRIGTHEEATGRVRGLYLTVANLSFVLAPLFAGYMLTVGSFPFLHTAAGMVALMLTWWVVRLGATFTDPHYASFRVSDVYTTLVCNGPIRYGLITQFLLRLLYSIMVVYTALFAEQTLGLSIATTGLILSLSILPFIAVQYPLGMLSDSRWGEKEFLVAGFAIAALGTFLLVTVPHKAPLWFAGVLALQSLGAAVIEVMSESYFFKHVRSKNRAELVAFRALAPLAYLVGPLVGSMVLSVGSMHSVFALLAALVALGVPTALLMKDTR